MATRRPADYPDAVGLYTVGHSTRSIDELLDMLGEHGIELLVDVRRFPGSRRHPHFAREALAASVRAAGIEYRWLEALGGRRSRRPDSPHTAWRVPAFAGYADHMDTPGFQAAAAELIAEASRRAVAVMCAEARPEQCHRRLIADHAIANGMPVTDILARGRSVAHQLPEFARVESGRVVYDVGQLPLRQE
jgi:uncharacterized protein (DUF488 family)